MSHDRRRHRYMPTRLQVTQAYSNSKRRRSRRRSRRSRHRPNDPFLGRGIPPVPYLRQVYKPGVNNTGGRQNIGHIHHRRLRTRRIFPKRRRSTSSQSRCQLRTVHPSAKHRRITGPRTVRVGHGVLIRTLSRRHVPVNPGSILHRINPVLNRRT